MRTLKVALVQLDSQNNKAANLEKSEKFIRQAAALGAEFVLLPETFNLRRAPNPKEQAETIDGPTVQFLQHLAKPLGIHILAGSICEKVIHKSVDVDDEEHLYNTSVLIDAEGQVKATYRKIHLFESSLENACISESRVYKFGDSPVLTEVNDIKVGLSICYDLRFPELYRHYAHEGVQALTAPSSFTSPTGEAHWEVLLRARAIENLSYVLAPNQVGLGSCSVPTYGNSMVIDPWGKIITRASADQEEVITATLDLDHLTKSRQSFPVLSHARFFRNLKN